jgi:ATP-dependent helicase/DNAse subunit B
MARYNPDMTVYSYSRINTYFTCPAQFQYRYILKLPSPVAEGVELFLGSRFHETMEYLYHQIPQRVPTVNELMDYFKKHWASQYQEAVEKQKQKGFESPLRIVNESQTVEDYFQKGQLYLEN